MTRVWVFIPGAITSFVERLDGQALLGRRLEALDAAILDAYAERLGISVIVALDEDAPRLGTLDHPSFFGRTATVGPFWLYERRQPVRLPAPAGPGRWIVAATGAPGDWMHTHTTFDPLWRAERGGTPLETRRGAAWDLEVRLSAGAGPVILTYAAGLPKVGGTLLSALGLAAWGALAWRQRLLRP